MGETLRVEWVLNTRLSPSQVLHGATGWDSVWGEMPDWGANLRETNEFLRQWHACLTRDINHPSIITWVPTNERTSPDDPTMNRIKVQIYEATRALDPTRPVIDTSGYCHTKTDVTDLHVNPPDGKACRRWWDDWRRSIAASNFRPTQPSTYSQGFRHRGQPVVISETGNWRSAVAHGSLDALRLADPDRQGISNGIAISSWP